MAAVLRKQEKPAMQTRPEAVFALLLAATVSVLGSQSALAASVSVPTSITLDTPVALTLNKNIDFGTVRQGSCTYFIDTSGSVSVVSGSGCGYLTGATAAASVSFSAAGTVTYGVGGYTADRGVTPSDAECEEVGGGITLHCLGGAASSTASGTVLIGVHVTTDGTQAGGITYSPSMVLTVTLQ